MARLARVERSVDIDVPRRSAYNQWTQFEEFPRFMEGVEEVKQLDDRHVRWKAKVFGRLVTWTAEILEQIPDRRIEWRSTGGAINSGMITFDPLSDLRTRVTVLIDYEPDGFTQSAADLLGIVGRRVEEDLQRFKDYIEARGVESGAWRGAIGHSNAPPARREPPPLRSSTTSGEE